MTIKYNIPLASNAVWGVYENGNIYYCDAPDGRWMKIGGLKLNQIDVGGLGVFGVAANHKIYYRIGTRNNPQSTGSAWQKYEPHT